MLLGRGFTLSPRGPAAEVERAPVDPDARTFVYFLRCCLPPRSASSRCSPAAPENFLAPALVVLSALAVIVLAPDRIRIVHQRLTQYTWAMLLLLPPLIVAIAVLLLPWTFAVDLRVAQPAAEMGRFFAESFERRTGRPLAIVTGDTHTAALVALDRAEPAEPRILRHARAVAVGHAAGHRSQGRGRASGRRPTRAACRRPAIQQRFPDLVAEVPRAFERRFQGRLPLTRIGWGVIRPSASCCTCAVDQC